MEISVGDCSPGPLVECIYAHVTGILQFSPQLVHVAEEGGPLGTGL